MARETLIVIDSSGKEFAARRSWVEKKHANHECFLGTDGKYRFPARPQHNGGASHEKPQGVGARLICRARTLRPNEPTPDIGGFLPYPYAEPSGRDLRSKYPGLAQMGAGLR